MLGTKMKIVSGYPGGNDIVLAMERGELQGRCGWSWSSIKATHGSWIAEKQLNMLVQLSLQKHPDLPDVPLIVDLAKTDEQRQILKLIFARQVMGRPFLAPPGIPADRAAALRKAFMETHDGPGLPRRRRKKRSSRSTRSRATRCRSWWRKFISTPPEVAKKAAQLLAVK